MNERPTTLDGWQNRYPKIIKIYTSQQGRGKKADVRSDVRSFVHADDWAIKALVNSVVLPTDAETSRVAKIHRWACYALKYVTDDREYGSSEFWAMPDVTIARQRGDCDDMAHVIASMLLNAGVDPRRVRVNAGWVSTGDGKKGGHAWVTYLRESDNQWVALDACFYADPHDSIDSYKTQNQVADKYLEVWFSWNNLHCWDTMGQLLAEFRRVKDVPAPAPAPDQPKV